MSGISRIQEKREEIKTLANVPAGREIWFKDGDQAFVTALASGDEGDSMIDEIYMYTYRDGNRWINVLSEQDMDTSFIPSDTRPSHKFAFWAYVHEVIHAEKKQDSWEAIQGPGGKQLFKETVDDFKVVSLGFGRSDYIWNQLVDIYSDWGKLNKGVMRIKRTGSGLYDTSYTLAATARESELPDDKDSSELPAIRAYFKNRYGVENLSPTSENGVEETKIDDLF